MAELVAITVYTQDGPDAPILSFELYGELVLPGLALTPAVKDAAYHGAWTFTHIASGKCLAKALCMDCARTALRLDAVRDVDWTRPGPDVIADGGAKAAARLVAEIESKCAGWKCERFD